MTVNIEMLRECFKTALKLTEDEARQLNMDTDVWNFEKWDSLGHLSLILELERRFGVRFNEDRTAELVSVAEILKALNDSA